MTRFPFDIVGFDLDGTLLDTLADLGVAVNHALSLERRAPIAPGSVRDLIGGGALQMLRRALDRTGGAVSEERLGELHRALLDHYRANIAVHSRLFPGGEAMLAALAERGVKLAVVTNKLESLAVQLLGELGLADRFFTIIGGDTLGRGRAKPARDLIDLMIERSGLADPRAAYVGDTSFDTGAARAAGIPCVVVRFGYNDADPETLGGAAVIDHFDALVPLLETLGRSDGS